MLFTATDFLCFLPFAFAAYWLARRWGAVCQNLVVIALSYIFYGWLDPRLCVLLFACTAFAYLVGGRLQGERARLWLTVGVVIELGGLAVFKYYNFFVLSLVTFLNALGVSADLPTLSIVLPIGISFYTFMAISYMVDVYRDPVFRVKSPHVYFAAMSFFPQLLSGPIGRVSSLSHEFADVRWFDRELAADGCRQMLWGYFKKLLIADGCSVLSVRLLDGAGVLPASTLLLGAFIYTVQIYADFSGYSDLAIGCGKLFGIRLQRNFAYPYFATNISEFWRRWHMSLTTWFRDYVYIPLGGSRCSKVRQVFNTAVVFLLSGLWHGANWTFVLWGAVHACLFVPMIILGRRKQVGRWTAVHAFCGWFVTMFNVMLAWVVFQARDISSAWAYFCALCDRSLFSLPHQYLSMMPWIAVTLAFEWFQRRREHALEVQDWPRLLRWSLYLLVTVLCIAYRRSDAEFIYFQF